MSDGSRGTGLAAARGGANLLTLDELAHDVAVNGLRPWTMIATAAVQSLLGGDEATRRARTAEIVADAALPVLERDLDSFVDGWPAGRPL